MLLISLNGTTYLMVQTHKLQIYQVTVGAVTRVQWLVCAFHSSSPAAFGLNPKHTIHTYFIIILLISSILLFFFELVIKF